MPNFESGNHQFNQAEFSSPRHLLQPQRTQLVVDFAQQRLKASNPFDNSCRGNSSTAQPLLLPYQNEEIILNHGSVTSVLESYGLESHSLPSLTLMKRKSDSYDYFSQEQCIRCEPFFHFNESQLVEFEELPHKSKKAHQFQPYSPFSPCFDLQQQSELKETYSNPQTQQEKQYKFTHRVGLTQTKNVTKNMGKLLFKFIWRYRRTLGQQIQVEKSRWEEFMKTVSEWKRQNNITREYLISKWHGTGKDSALFRTISRHFFRKRCLAAILKSNIHLKRVHYSRITQFSRAITDPTALDSIA